MIIKIQWTETSDQLFFDVINEEITSWFIEKCKESNTKFNIGDMITDVPVRAGDTEKFISEISTAIDLVNNFLPKINQPILAKPDNWYDQQQLNQLHKDWSRSRKAVPNLPPMLYKLDKKLFDAYNISNCHIHLIEDSFKYRYRDNLNHWRRANPYKDVTFEWHSCHLFLPYPGHGRHAFEKFENLDNDVFVDDLCNWDNVDSCLGMNLSRPYKITPPIEFLEWCDQYQLIPHNHIIPLGNLVNWKDNLTTARGLVIKNNTIPNNYFVIDIN